MSKAQMRYVDRDKRLKDGSGRGKGNRPRKTDNQRSECIRYSKRDKT